jgi:hypothetical protein
VSDKLLDEVSEPLEVEAKVLELQGESANATADDDDSSFFGRSFFGSAKDTPRGGGGDRATMAPGARAAAAGGDDGASDSVVFDFSMRHVASDMVMQILEPLFEMLIIDDQAGDERNDDGEGIDGGSAARDAEVTRPAASIAASTEGCAAARGGSDASSWGSGSDGAPSRALPPTPSATKSKRASPFQFTERGLELVRPITLRQRTLVALAGGKFGFGNVRLGRCVIDTHI